MITTNKKLRFAVLAGLVLASGALIVHAQEEEDQAAALPADQVIAAIRAAVEAKPGQILEVESETEKGATFCEVKVLAADGKTYEVVVSAATGKVTEVELDDDANEAKDDD